MRVTTSPGLDQVDLAVRELVRAGSPLLLAVSGGCDSMVLMHAVARALGDVAGSRQPKPIIGVITFDHGTGEAGARAASLVETEGARAGFAVQRGGASLAGATEAEWRAARWRFFRSAAASAGAMIATAHTRDDQLETVVMRAMRGAGARGLAGLAAGTPGVSRPFLAIPRSALRRYARARRVPFIDDPSNESRAHFRNRVRHDLLPAISRLDPEFGDTILALADRAAELRRSIEALAPRFFLGATGSGGFRVARPELATYDSTALCVLWPAIAASAGVTLDRRGTLRLAQFTRSSAAGALIQLSGGVDVLNSREAFVLRRAALPNRTSGVVPLAGLVEFGEWRFSPVAPGRTQSLDTTATRDAPAAAALTDKGDAWTAELPAHGRLVVREWRPGDRMCVGGTGTARRVKRFLADARVPGPHRAGWPVVLWEDEIVWIPGVRRSHAVAERSGRPTVRYTCERFDDGLLTGS